MHTVPWSSTLTTKLGLVRLPTCRVANPTPAATVKKHTSMGVQKHEDIFTCNTFPPIDSTNHCCLSNQSIHPFTPLSYQWPSCNRQSSRWKSFSTCQQTSQPCSRCVVRWPSAACGEPLDSVSAAVGTRCALKGRPNTTGQSRLSTSRTGPTKSRPFSGARLIELS